VLAGIDDWTAGAPDLEAALSTRRGPQLLLSHNPDAFFEAASRGADLVLSGHTHGGQIRLPGLGAAITMSRYRLCDGHYTFAPGGASEPSQLVVSRGLGVVGLPLRLACPPEAVLLTLRASLS
jgi:predicted MPP superfamily phosphohydrolase